MHQELHRNPSSGASIFRVFKEVHEDSRTREGMMSPVPGDESAVRTTILDATNGDK
jgi:hypothetical protein